LKAIICLNGHGKGEDDGAKEGNQSMTFDKRLTHTFKLGKKNNELKILKMFQAFSNISTPNLKQN
jgi:hypothetical protein